VVSGLLSPPVVSISPCLWPPKNRSFVGRTTIGYGDFSPTTPLTKVITMFYGVNGVIVLLILFDVIRRLRASGSRLFCVGDQSRTPAARWRDERSRYHYK
jgi:hypothetical protein